MQSYLRELNQNKKSTLLWAFWITVADTDLIETQLINELSPP